MVQRIVIGCKINGPVFSRKVWGRLKELHHPKVLEEAALLEQDEEKDDPVDQEWLRSIYIRDAIPRNDPTLLQVLDELGLDVAGKSLDANYSESTLDILEIPDGVEWEVVEYENGVEYVAEKHRTWDSSKSIYCGWNRGV